MTFLSISIYMLRAGEELCVWMCVLRGIILLLPTSNSSKNVITALQADACQQKERVKQRKGEGLIRGQQGMGERVSDIRDMVFHPSICPLKTNRAVISRTPAVMSWPPTFQHCSCI